MTKSHHVVIVGSSIAGAVTAHILSSNGLKVALVDKQEFPRRKPCGEGLSRKGYEVLQRLGLEGVVSGVWLDGYRIHSRESSPHLIGNVSGVLGVRRVDLDAALAHGVGEDSNLETFFNQGVVSVKRHGRSFVVETTASTFECSILVAADGIDSKTLTMVGVPRTPRRELRCGLSSSWRVVNGTAQQFVETFLLEGGEAFLTPVAEGLVNVSFLGTKKFIGELAREGARRRLVSRLARELSLELAEQCRPMGVSGVNYGFRAAAGPPGVLAVGDACEALDPVAGMGMTHAILSAQAASEAILAAYSGDEFDFVKVSEYAGFRELHVRGMRGFTRLTGFGLSSSVGRTLLPLFVKTGVAKVAATAVHAEGARGVVSASLRGLGRLPRGAFWCC